MDLPDDVHLRLPMLFNTIWNSVTVVFPEACAGIRVAIHHDKSYTVPDVIKHSLDILLYILPGTHA
jgi:hypothetical protein